MIRNSTLNKKEALSCYHCGDNCLSDSIVSNEKHFCCNGCKTVYELLSSNELCDYYAVENMPGINMQAKQQQKFDYLEHTDVLDRLLDYQDDSISKVQFYLPQIHCSACLWLLENLYKINENIHQSRVNFLKKELYLTFDHNRVSLKQLVELLSSIGYEPLITSDLLDQQQKKKLSKRLIYQIGLAGFAFGNIMLMSLPEYFGLDIESYHKFSPWFGWINLLLATPVAIYSGQDYFKSAWKSISQKRMNIDVPIALGVLVLFLRSSYEVISATGAGYFDSLCALLFFLLLGRIFQEKIYHQLSFERDYRSYFPISVTKLLRDEEKNIPISEIKKGDKILIRNKELIPVDAYLLKGDANIDNSFATGESAPQQKVIGDKIYAGGRQIGASILVEVIRPLNQSKLSRLWSDYTDRKHSSSTFSSMTDRVSYWFTPIILIVGFVAGLFHLEQGIGKALEVMSAVFIVACPCALALAAPFTFGHATRWLGQNNCYLREAEVIEKITKIDHIVFDKTGTLTHGNRQSTDYVGTPLTEEEKTIVSNLVNQSNHPLSRLIKQSLASTRAVTIEHFEEHEGKGIQGKVNGQLFRIGSPSWLNDGFSNSSSTLVAIEVDSCLKGRFIIDNEFRKGLKPLLNELAQNFRLSLISGDNSNQEELLKPFFPNKSLLLFNQQPDQKLQVVQSLQQKGDRVMMIGDGLNDAGALREAKVGISISENVNAFSPACDVILDADQFSKLASIISFTKACKKIVIISFVISFLYNGIGLFFAVQGLLSPVFAAILMPISSISVVGFVSLAVWLIRPR